MSDEELLAMLVDRLRGNTTAEPAPKAKAKRKPSKYNQVYGKHFKKVQGKYKKKNGQWKKDGFKRAGAEARRLTKKELKR